MEVLQTEQFTKWLSKLRDRDARGRIVTRLFRLARGNSGDSRSVGSGVIELKISIGPGYRAYYIVRGTLLVVLLCGGDKSTQPEDIQRAKELAEEIDGLELKKWP